jgi:hypothetical protein
MIKKMHNFVHFLPCGRLPKEPKNRGFLRSKAAKIHKSHRLLGYMDILITNEDTARWLINNRTPFAVGESEISGRERSHKGEIYAG